MNRVGKFEKVSYGEYIKSMINCYGTDWLSDNNITYKTYDLIRLPHRATIGSAGYDFYLPFDLKIKPGATVLIPTGIRVSIENGWVLKCYPRSGLGFKYKLQLDNTVGIIDSDYYYSDNEGHIFVKLTNDNRNNKAVEIKSGDKYIQGVFVPYGITYDDDVENIRNGGFGSTDK